MAEKAGLNKTQAEAALVAFMETVIDTVAGKGNAKVVGPESSDDREVRSRGLDIDVWIDTWIGVTDRYM